MSPAKHFNKTRLAPTPSGFLHLGNVMSFLLTTQLAQETGAKILLRIDDLDRDRVNNAYVQDIFDTLIFTGINWQEGPRNLQDYLSNWSQLHRTPLYDQALNFLRNADAVFACECTRTQLRTAASYPGTCLHKDIPLDKPGVNWRLKTDTNTSVAINTLNDGPLSVYLPDSMHYFIVRKKDGYPAYQLSSLVDDVHFNVDLIVRGADLWPSTIAQVYLAAVLQAEAFQQCTFHHHPLLMADDNAKLSKSAGATSIHYLRQSGKTARDIIGLIGGSQNHLR